MVVLPDHNNLKLENFTAIFKDTTNSYKFYWFLAILDSIKEKDTKEILIEELFERMISFVWYPLVNFKLSFGKEDGFKNITDFVSQNISIDSGTNAESMWKQIDNQIDTSLKKIIKQRLRVLSRWVPYRFIRPFFSNETRSFVDQQVNNQLASLANSSSQSDPTRCPYYFTKEKIILNTIWFDYFKNNIGILQSFTYWHLLKFLQKNNPNVIGISEKLFKPTQRNLKKKIESWKLFIEVNPQTNCIYSKRPIPKDFALDHFLPWSFLVHDLNWNLIPVEKTINSSKSDFLPNLDLYLNPFTDIQFEYLHTPRIQDKFPEIMEEYCLLFDCTMIDLVLIAKEKFKEKFKDTIFPFEQIASNLGFVKNWIYTS